MSLNAFMTPVGAADRPTEKFARRLQTLQAPVVRTRPQPVAVHQTGPQHLFTATAGRAHQLGERFGVGTHHFPGTVMQLRRRQISQIRVQQAQPGIGRIEVADVQRHGARRSPRVERLTPGPGIGDRAAVRGVDQRPEQRQARRRRQPLGLGAQRQTDREVPAGRVAGHDDLRRVMPLIE
jgi:hypothetical protein